MMSIIIFQRGKLGLALALLRIMPWLALMMARLYSNQRTKERLLHHCFGRMSKEEFDSFCQHFAEAHRHILRTDLYQRLKEEKRKGNEVVVVTASPENWVSRLVPEFKVLGTKMEFRESGFTGRFLSPNCYGLEKVCRLKQEFPDLHEHRDEHYITAFGDSRGDKELLEFADEGHLIK